jgi:hypothetical protein
MGFNSGFKGLMNHIRDRMQNANSPVNWDMGCSVKDNAFHNQNIGPNNNYAELVLRVDAVLKAWLIDTLE